MSSSMSTLSKLNNSTIGFLEKPVIKYGFFILVVLQIIMIKKLNTSYLQIFDDNLFKVIYAFLIAYYACFDPVYSIALTTLMIISIQELHNRNATHGVVSLLPKPNMKYISENPISNPISNSISNSISNPVQNTSNCIISSNKMKAKIFDNDELVFDLINQHSLQKQPTTDDKLIAEYDFCHEPAYKTITDNIKNTGQNQYENNSLVNIQNNQLIDANQSKSLQGLQGDILNIQGLPNGFDTKHKFQGSL